MEIRAIEGEFETLEHRRSRIAELLNTGISMELRKMLQQSLADVEQRLALLMVERQMQPYRWAA